MRRELLGTYAIVLSGLLLGLLAGIFVADAQPAVLGWIFGAGAGLLGGAFVAAVAANEPVIGGRTRPQAPLFGDAGDVESPPESPAAPR